MKHVLLTQFALRWPEGHQRRKWERSGWVDYRLELFRKYTLPSVQAQTFKDFDWWLIIDPTFPGLTSRHTNQLRQYGKILVADKPIEDGSVEEGRLLSEHYKDEWVCSTRLDSDDIIRNDFMEKVNAEASEEEAFITFRYGYMLKDGKIASRLYTRNPFVSYVEYAAPFRGIYATSHKHVHRQKAPLKIIEEVPGWIQVDHGDNVKNLVNRKMKDFDSRQVELASVCHDFTWEV